MVLTIYDFKVEDALEHPRGISQTVPNESTSLKDLVRRAWSMAKLPEIAQSMESGEDEDFDDAFDADDQMIDYLENKEYIQRLRDKIAEEKAKKANFRPNEPSSEVDPIEEPSKQ